MTSHDCLVVADQFTQLINITQLDLSKNSLTELPADFGNLVSFDVLICEHVKKITNFYATFSLSEIH